MSLGTSVAEMKQQEEEEEKEERRHGRWVGTLSSGWGTGSRARHRRQQVHSASFLLSLLLPTKSSRISLGICEFV